MHSAMKYTVYDWMRFCIVVLKIFFLYCELSLTLDVEGQFGMYRSELIVTSARQHHALIKDYSQLSKIIFILTIKEM